MSVEHVLSNKFSKIMILGSLLSQPCTHEPMRPQVRHPASHRRAPSSTDMSVINLDPLPSSSLPRNSLSFIFPSWHHLFLTTWPRCLVSRLPLFISSSLLLSYFFSDLFFWCFQLLAGLSPFFFLLFHSLFHSSPLHTAPLSPFRFLPFTRVFLLFPSLVSVLVPLFHISSLLTLYLFTFLPCSHVMLFLCFPVYLFLVPLLPVSFFSMIACIRFSSFTHHLWPRLVPLSSSSWPHPSIRPSFHHSSYPISLLSSSSLCPSHSPSVSPTS